MSYQPPYPGPTPSYYPPQEGYDQPFVFDQKSPYENDRFRPKKKINDPIFLVLFILQFIGFTVLSAIVLKEWVDSGSPGGGLGKGGANTGLVVTLNASTAYLLLLVTGAALLLSTLYLIMTRAFTSIVIHVSLILSIVLNIGLCIYYWITKYYSAAIIFTLIAILSVFSYWGMRSLIPFASLLLQVVIDVSKHHKSVFVVAFIALFLQAGMAVWFIFTAIATYTKFTPGSTSCATTACSSGKVAGLIFYELFSFLWTSQVIGNVALATVAGGPYGTWYYFGPKSAGQMPPHPTWSAFVRSSTLSLGSIAFGSLIVTILEMIRIILRIIQSNASADGHPVEAILACCAGCIVGCIENLIEWFNRYAYIEIALYGKKYTEAAKDTWRLFVDRGIVALVNDSLVGMAMIWGAYAVGCLSALFAYLYLRITKPTYNVEGNYTAPVILFAFMIGLQCCMTVTSPIEAGVSTIFVGLGEDPQVLNERAPALFSMIAGMYPDVVIPISHA